MVNDTPMLVHTSCSSWQRLSAATRFRILLLPMVCAALLTISLGIAATGAQRATTSPVHNVGNVMQSHQLSHVRPWPGGGCGGVAAGC